jgi:phosphoglycerol transferase MdoB-like AlkP superfamily enzyme
LKIIQHYIKACLLLLFVFEFSRLYFVIYNISYFDDSFFLSFVKTALEGLRLDLSAVAYCITPFLVLWLCEFVAGRKSPSWIPATLIVTEFLLIFLVTISDAELFIQWGNKFNNQVLVYVSHPKEMVLAAGATNWIKTLLYSTGLLGFMYYAGKRLFMIIDQERENKSGQAYLPLLLAGLNFIMLRGGVGVANISQSSAIYSARSVNNAAAVNSLWNALYYVVNNAEDIYGDWYVYADGRKARLEFERQVKDERDTSITFTNSNRPNVLIIMLESFTASASSFFSGQGNCMPYLDSIARNSLSFMHCYASGDRTDKGLVSIISGYPAQPASSVIIFPDKVDGMPGLGRVLRREGYSNIFIYGGDAEYASMKSYLTMQDFAHIIDRKDFAAKKLNSKWGTHDANMYEKSLSVLKNYRQPFFSVMLTLSSHEPFDVPFESPDLKHDNWYPFRNSLRYADKCLHDFMETCKSQPWYDNTIIVLVADHGHDIGLENTFYFGKEKYHIPLILAGGALKDEYRGVQVDDVVSQTIIPRLLLENMGLETTDFRWQTGIGQPGGFAQYHYNNGFGRVNNRSECVSDNSSGSYYFRGEKSDSLRLMHDGKIFQQILIADFLKK